MCDSVSKVAVSERVCVDIECEYNLSGWGSQYVRYLSDRNYFQNFPPTMARENGQEML